MRVDLCVVLGVGLIGGGFLENLFGICLNSMEENDFKFSEVVVVVEG